MFKHNKGVGETYFQHLRSAWGIGFRLCLSGFFFILHGIIPIPIPEKFNLGEMALKLRVENRMRRMARKLRGSYRSVPDDFYSTDD